MEDKRDLLGQTFQMIKHRALQPAPQKRRPAPANTRLWFEEMAASVTRSRFTGAAGEMWPGPVIDLGQKPD